ncbi:hypothetical protein VBM89_02700 [Mycoplasma sp. 1199]|uniref:hypothetical protein n=1 Tax=Mycoplasma sp. 1199 TaxID=3108526 RepID=UPI002B1D4C50|nr:hypothetical protein [Mycoplasma sp. 1199]MEA4206413.1 hypothetical protein [Mycoplasma sp. 1199]
MKNKKYYTNPIFWLSLIWIFIISVAIIYIIWSAVVIQKQGYYYYSEWIARIKIIISIIATITFILHIILMFLQIIAIVRLFHRKTEDDIVIAVLYILACVFGPIFSFGSSILAKKYEIDYF